MTRFCAGWGASVTEIGGVEQVAASPLSLGLLPGTPSGGAGRYTQLDGAHMVGEVTLFDLPGARASLRRYTDVRTAAEVFLAAFMEQGPRALEHLPGAYAAAIWHAGALWLLRDVAGACTMFYAHTGGTWLASDSLYDLRSWAACPPRLDYRGLAAFLAFAYVPGADTLLAGYREVLPGEVLRIDADGLSAQRVGLPQEARAVAQSPEPHITALRADLETAVRSALPDDDIPVGVTLSGGVDSSLVTALAARMHTAPVHTYSLDFGPGKPDESAFSGLVAAHCGTQHHIVRIRERDIRRYFADTLRLLDAPVGDPLTVPNFILARAAAGDGLSVLLNGEGGDPLFGGPKNIPMLLYEYHRTEAAPADRYRAYLRAYRKCYEDLPFLLTPDAWRAVQATAPLDDIIAPYLGPNHLTQYVNKLMWANTALKGAHHILPKVGRLVAAQGMQARSPLFDPRIMARAFAIPPEYKLHGEVEKWALKQAVADVLPPPIIARPKSGMRVPVRHWLNGVLRHMAHELLLGRRARARGLFQPQMLRAWLRDETRPGDNAGVKLWLVLSLEMWLRIYLDGDDV
ncbi:MAG: asparagine synthetase B family protein [Anaerolineales bacterium]